MIRVARRPIEAHGLSDELQRIAPGASQRDAIRRTAYTPGKVVDSWLDGTVIPSNKSIFRIGKALELSQEGVAELLRRAELDRSVRAVHRNARQRHHIMPHLHLVGSRRG